MTTQTNTFKYPETAADHLRQSGRNAAVGAAVGTAASLLFSGVASAGYYVWNKAPDAVNYAFTLAGRNEPLATLSPTLATAANVATSAGAVGAMMGTLLVGYATWPRYTAWQSSITYDWHTNHRSDLPLRYAFLSMAASALAGGLISFGGHKAAEAWLPQQSAPVVQKAAASKPAPLPVLVARAA